MKHLTIDGCTVTITGPSEANLEKALLKLVTKPTRYWRFSVWVDKEPVEFVVEGPGMTEREACNDAARVLAAAYPDARKILYRDIVEVRPVTQPPHVEAST